MVGLAGSDEEQAMLTGLLHQIKPEDGPSGNAENKEKTTVTRIIRLIAYITNKD